MPKPKKSPGRPKGILAAMLLLLGAFAAGADTFTVTNTADSGAGSLRKAIDDANALAGLDTIEFDIPGAGVHTIEVPTGSAVDHLAGDHRRHDAAGLRGSAAHRAPRHEHQRLLRPGRVEHVSRPRAQRVRTGDPPLQRRRQRHRGLLHRSRCDRHDGPASLRSRDPHHQLDGNVIGGSSPSSRNLLSGNGNAIGVESSDGTVIQGNLIGTDVTGTKALANSGGGISLSNANNTTIGGSEAGERNVISGNASGIAMNGGANVVIHGNCIGTDITGTKALGNAMGINDSGMDNVSIGGSGPGEGNLISGNKGIRHLRLQLRRRHDHPRQPDRNGRDRNAASRECHRHRDLQRRGRLPDRRNRAGGSQHHRVQQGIPRLRSPRRRPDVRLQQTDSDPRATRSTTTRNSASP